MNRSPHIRAPRILPALIALFTVGTVGAQTTVPPAGLTQPPPSATAAITGHVTDEDGKPIPGATVRIVGGTQGAIAKTDGSFTIGNVRLGDYELRVTAIGRPSLAISVRVGPEGTSMGTISVSSHKKPDDDSNRGCPRRGPYDLWPEQVGTVRRIRFDN